MKKEPLMGAPVAVVRLPAIVPPVNTAISSGRVLLIDGNFDASQRMSRCLDSDDDVATQNAVEREGAVILRCRALSAAGEVLLGFRWSKTDLGTGDAGTRAVLEHAPA